MPEVPEHPRAGQRETRPRASLASAVAGALAAPVAAWIEYYRDLGIHDFYRLGEPQPLAVPVSLEDRPSAPADDQIAAVEPAALPRAAAPVVPPEPARAIAPTQPLAPPAPPADPTSQTVPAPIPFDKLAPPPAAKIPAADRPAALRALQDEIGDCTRCPLAYAGRRTIVFADGSPSARLMFIGEGPGADEDAQGLPFVGKAGQLLNNMIAAMGLERSEVYIANIVKCRPPANRVPEPVEANTCSPFLLRQIDIVQPEVIVALGSTAATYLLGVKQSLSSLRGHWHSSRGAKVAVTYHPAFLLRDPRMKAEAWKDLQMVMGQLGLKAPQKKPSA
jgi:uracil-DNA glycosylase family 4